MTSNTLPLFPLEGRFPTDRQPRISTLPFIRSESFEPNRMGEDYVDTTLAPQPTSNVVFHPSASAQGASETPSSPLDVTMLAMLGLTLAGAGVMKSQSAQKKQQELAQANAVAQAQLATAKAQQAQTATTNWAENQAMQASATQKVYTKVQQSQANMDFWASYAAWKIKVAEAEEKRRQAELEARIKAYYAALRLKPASPQPVQSMPVLGLLKGLLTGAKILGQGIKTFKSVVKAIAEKNNANKPAGVGSGSSGVVGGGSSGGVGAMGGGFGAGAIGGLTISPNWGDFSVSQSQDDDEEACQIESDNIEALGFVASLVEIISRPQEKIVKELFLGLGITLTTRSVVLANECGTESDVLHNIVNGLVISVTGVFGGKIALAGLGVIFIKELIRGLEPGKTADENLMDTNVIPNYCPPDGIETVGDDIIAFLGREFYLGDNGFPHHWDTGRFVTHNPVDAILESNEFTALVQERFLNIIRAYPQNIPSTAIAGILTAFEGEFSNFANQNIDIGLQPYQYIQIGDRLFDYPLIAEASLIYHLHTTNQLNEAMVDGFVTRLEQLGVENPIEEFIDPVRNGEISTHGRCE